MTIILLLFVSSSSLDAVPQSVTPPPTPVEINELPENMPLVTRLLWGEQGLIRTLGLAPKDRIAELKLRTFMLQTHQKFALGTVALLSGQAYTGMLMAKGKTDGYEKTQEIHSSLADATFAAYIVTGSLSYLVPPAVSYKQKVDPIRLHRWLSYLHMAGMAALPVLGEMVEEPYEYNISYDDALRLHRSVGLVTLGAVILSAVLTLF
ncbi:MAG: hypothetical protein CMF77_00080 [Candidatus Marinimicrobia bacterium]|nr:hypothetical protein [Candidatus Neomarinimicrobiota bacterium]